MFECRCVLLFVLPLLILSAGCSTQSYSKINITDHGVIVVERSVNPTEIVVTTESPFQWDIVREGALDGAVNCVRIQHSGGADELLQALLCIPVNGLIGAIAALVAEPSPPPIAVDALEEFVGIGRADAVIRGYTEQLARDAGMQVVAQQQASLANASLQLWLRRIHIQAVSRGRSVSVSLNVALQVSLFPTGHNQASHVQNIELQSSPRHYQDWITDDFAPLTAFLLNGVRTNVF